MRLIKVKGPQGYGQQIADLAFSSGIDQVSLHQEQILSRERQPVMQDVIDAEAATPKAKAFVDSLMEAGFFEPSQFSINVRQPRTVVSKEHPSKITWPLIEPTSDVFEELWQSTHVTYGFVGRCFVAAVLLAFGVIHAKILIIIAGLLFYPLLPAILAMSFGLCTRTWRLSGQGIGALAAAMAVGVAGGALVASLSEPPVRWSDSTSLVAAALISLAVGIAGALATSDDSGERSLIGLAATAQIALVPVWFGIVLIFGAENSGGSTPQKLIQLGINIGCLTLGAWLTYVVLRFKGTGLRHVQMEMAKLKASERSSSA